MVVIIDYVQNVLQRPDFGQLWCLNARVRIVKVFKDAYRHYYRASVSKYQTPHAQALLDYYFALLLTERGRSFGYWLYDEHQVVFASLKAPSSLVPLSTALS